VNQPSPPTSLSLLIPIRKVEHSYLPSKASSDQFPASKLPLSPLPSPLPSPLSEPILSPKTTHSSNPPAGNFDTVMLPAQDAGLQISPPPPQSEPIPSSVSTHSSNLLAGNFDTGGWLQDVSVTSERPPNFSTAGNPPQPSLSIINGVPSEPIPLSKSPQSYSPLLEISILLNPCSCLMHLASRKISASKSFLSRPLLVLYQLRRIQRIPHQWVFQANQYLPPKPLNPTVLLQKFRHCLVPEMPNMQWEVECASLQVPIPSYLYQLKGLHRIN
jgi:hypothetical protein